MIYEDTYSGTIIVEEDRVIKKFRETAIRQGLMDREAFWLTLLSSFDRTPNIISVNEDSIIMTNVGERISKETVPEDWKEQIQYIYDNLQKFGCCHNDIKPEELLVKDGKIQIIDFGWSTKIGESIPPDWPREIGDEFAFGIHTFNDLYSLKKSIDSILSK